MFFGLKAIEVYQLMKVPVLAEYHAGSRKKFQLILVQVRFIHARPYTKFA